jgi:hypothetical protein
MKKSLAVGCLLFLVCQSPICGSAGQQFVETDDNEEQNTMVSSLPMMDSRLQIGGNYTWVSIHPHGHTSFEGSLGGMQWLYEYRPMNRFYGGAKLAWRAGETRGDSGERSLLYVDVQERLGYTFCFDNDDFFLTLYSGWAIGTSDRSWIQKKGLPLNSGIMSFTSLSEGYSTMLSTPGSLSVWVLPGCLKFIRR